MSKTITPLGAVIRGAMAGLAGALAIRLAMQYAMQASQKPAPPEEPTEKPPQAEDPREKLVRKVATGIFETELPEPERKTWAEMLHWEYGAFWGVVYGIVQASLWLPLWLHGILLGTVVWITGPLVLLPAMKLSPRPQDQPLDQVFKGWWFHAVYGLTTAVVFGGLTWRRCRQQEE